MNLSGIATNAFAYVNLPDVAGMKPVAMSVELSVVSHSLFVFSGPYIRGDGTSYASVRNVGGNALAVTGVLHVVYRLA